MRDLATISIGSDASINLDDFYFYIDYMMFNNPRKLGRGSRRLGSRGWKLQGNTAPAMLRSCTANNCAGNELCSEGPWLGDDCRLLTQTPGEER